MHYSLASPAAREPGRLQFFQNTQRSVICRLPRRARTSKYLKALHWLPVKYRIKFKTCVHFFKTLRNCEPWYIKEYLKPYTCSVNTRWCNLYNKNLETIHYDSKMHKYFLQLSHTFSYSALREWNELPLKIRSSPSLSSIRKSVKTFFQLVYPP